MFCGDINEWKSIRVLLKESQNCMLSLDRLLDCTE